MSETETQEQTTGEGDGSAAGQDQHNGGSGARTALKVGALAAAAGTAAFAASKAMTSRGEKSEESAGSSSEDGDGKSRALSGKVSMEQLISAIGNARWDVLKDLVVPFAESGAKSAGAFVAKEGPDILSESLVPKFLEGFNEAQGQRS